jgi:hypothetical protein
VPQRPVRPPRPELHPDLQNVVVVVGVQCTQASKPKKSSIVPRLS